MNWHKIPSLVLELGLIAGGVYLYLSHELNEILLGLLGMVMIGLGIPIVVAAIQKVHTLVAIFAMIWWVGMVLGFSLAFYIRQKFDNSFEPYMFWDHVGIGLGAAMMGLCIVTDGCLVWRIVTRNWRKGVRKA